MKVVDRTAKHGLHRVDHALATCREAVDAVAGAVPQRDTRCRALRVGTIDHVIADRGILFHRGEEQLDFLAIVHAGDDHETVTVIGVELR